MTAAQTQIVGSQFAPGARSILLTLTDAQELTLKRNPDNKYDSNAIEVRYEGSMLGHVPAVIAAALAPVMDAGEHIRCRIVGSAPNIMLFTDADLREMAAENEDYTEGKV